MVAFALAKRIVVTPSTGSGSRLSATTKANGFALIYRNAEDPSAAVITSNPSRKV
jgi:hypothetical protein